MKGKVKEYENKINDLNLKLSMMSNKFEEEKKANKKSIEILEKENLRLKEEANKENKENTHKKESNRYLDNENDDEKDKDKENKEDENNLETKPIITGTLEDNEKNKDKEIEDFKNKEAEWAEKEKELIKQNEDLKNKTNSLQNEKSELEGKIQKMKETMQEIKNKFDLELTQKIDMRNKIISEMKNEFSGKEDLYNSRISKLSKEKLDYEELIIKQDSKMNDLASKINQIETILKSKNVELKNYESQANSLIKIIEDQKRLIMQLKEEKKNFGNLENEIVYLRNYNESLKDDAVAKDEIIRDLKQRLAKKNKHLTNPNTINTKIYGSLHGETEVSQIMPNYKYLLGQNQVETQGDNPLSHSRGKVVLPAIKNNQNSLRVSNLNDSYHEGNDKNEIKKTDVEAEKSKAYSEFLRLENEERAKNEQNYEKINSLMKQVLESN